MKTEKVFFKKRNELNLAAFIYHPLDQHSRFYENGTLEEVIIINTRFKDHPNEK